MILQLMLEKSKQKEIICSEDEAEKKRMEKVYVFIEIEPLLQPKSGPNTHQNGKKSEKIDLKLKRNASKPNNDP